MIPTSVAKEVYKMHNSVSFRSKTLYTIEFINLITRNIELGQSHLCKFHKMRAYKLQKYFKL